MKTWIGAATIAGVFLLAGCQTKPIEAMGYTERNELAKVLVKRCIDQGVKHATPQMQDCLTVEAKAEAYRRYENRQRQIAMADAMAETGAQMQANARNQQLVNAINRPVTCTSTGGGYTGYKGYGGYGSTVRTTCY